MFKHDGNKRTLSHNLKIASLLSFVAGIVSTVGFFSVQRLTTNVTGHFAFFMDEIFKLHFKESFIYFFYIFSFFLGSFISNLIIEMSSGRSEKYRYTIPVLTESAVLFILGFFGQALVTVNPSFMACSLLFAMGFQNSFVTTISSSVVRTTHLTGLFTDLGIDLSQLFFYKSKEERKILLSSVQLRFTIIFFFFVGGITGGILFSRIGTAALIFASAALVLGIIYDHIQFKLLPAK